MAHLPIYVQTSLASRYPAACNRKAKAIVKHPACAAAINSSGLVPSWFSKRVLYEYGVFASTPESDERSPFPVRPLPRQTALALRIMEISPTLMNSDICGLKLL